MLHQILQAKTTQQFERAINLAEAISNGDFNFADKVQIWCNIYTKKYCDDNVILYSCGHDTILILPQKKEMKYGDMMTCTL